MNIPRKLHQIWYQGHANISDNGKICQNTVKKINNDWDYILWDEAAINNLVEKDYVWFKPYFNQDTNMIQKIDLAKYLILQQGRANLQRSISFCSKSAQICSRA